MLIIFLILLFIAALLASFANFYFIKTMDNLSSIILIASILVIIQYILKIYSYFELKHNFNIIILQSIWMIFTFIGAIIIKKLFLKEDIPIYSLIIGILIILLIICNILIENKK